MNRVRFIRVTSDKFTAYFQTDGVITRASKVLGFMVGWEDAKARSVIKRSGWKASQIITSEGKQEAIEALDLASPPSAALEEHICHCGKRASFGYGVRLRKGKIGTWNCFEHRPADQCAAA
ncbi:hypothetical protein [Bradyrhizobium sp. Leo121]|uniref:hypothetical protein n=1 Tax=Bradyrhizobium sp. Leo121 TaxID=1571195 RepID=UPI001029A39D|nr:hypothetical protein [Bradyrhizobium sp. Leo121]RZN30512.1 hypothetical protein CWO90_20460 [Bradyrhizobium sp. Leo121]